jgi:hypothetical protein
MLSFSFAIKKHNSTSIGRAKGHNERAHPTNSQLPKDAWFRPDPCAISVGWKDEKLAEAKGLAKRKDAVLAIELCVQVGDQWDWREAPTEEHKFGKPKNPPPLSMAKLGNIANEAARRIFGETAILSSAIHWDESTPHVQIIVVPINDGKLQAKHWVGGQRKCAEFRRKFHAIVNADVPCAYTPGAAGGKPHDATKRAGTTPPAPEGIIAKAKTLVGDQLDAKAENKTLKAMIADLGRQLKEALTAMKRSMLRADKAEKKAEVAEAEAREATKKEFERNQKIFKSNERAFEGLTHKVAGLEAKVEDLTEKLTGANMKIEGLAAENASLERELEAKNQNSMKF